MFLDITIYDNNGEKLYCFKDVLLNDCTAILRGAINNDNLVVIESAEEE